MSKLLLRTKPELTQVRSESKTPVESSRPRTKSSQKALSRSRILDSALSLFREMGYDGATMREIAARAGLTTGALFANFADKSDIFLKITEDETLYIMSAIRKAYRADLDVAECLIQQLFAGYEAANADLQLILSAITLDMSVNPRFQLEVLRIGRRLRHEINKTLEAALDKGEIPPTADLRSALMAFEDLCYSHMRRAFLKGVSLMDQLPKFAPQIRMIINGLKYV